MLKKVCTSIVLPVLLMFFGATQAQRPNIIFILVDDLGWSDTEVYGTTDFYKTPNIKRLATRGMLFNQAYTTSPVCSPTRASIMSGLHSARLGITQARGHLKEVRMAPAHVEEEKTTRKTIQIKTATRLDTRYYTLAEALHDAGYKTAHFGKWHLGLPPYGGLEQGFDIQIPRRPGGAISKGFLAPWPALTKQGFVGKPGEHLEDRMAQEAVAFMRAHANSKQPFFLNYWAFSIHSPWSAKADLTAKYAKQIDALSPQRNPVYAAMVQSMDEAVGTLLDAVDELKIADNTMIIFFSDNGGNTWAPPKTEPEGYAHIPGTSNYPLRAGKGWYYEGGVRVPLAVIWPGHIKPHQRSDALVSSVDFYPTILDMLKIKPQKGLVFDGQSFKSALLNKTHKRKPLFGYYPHYGLSDRIRPAIWVRRGDWKLIRFFNDNADQTDRLELYNLAHDIFESSNQAQRFPEIAQELNQLINEFIKDKGVLIPKANPIYGKST